MARNKDCDFLESALIIGEIKRFPVLYDTNHPHFAERNAKAQCWEQVCAGVFPDWADMDACERSANAKDIQKRWRSIRDSYTKQYRAGKCPPPSTLPSGGGRRLQHQRQMAFFYDTLANKTARPSIDKRMEQDQNPVGASTATKKDEPKIVANQIRLPSVDLSKEELRKVLEEADAIAAISAATISKVITPEMETRERRRRNATKTPDVEKTIEKSTEVTETKTPEVEVVLTEPQTPQVVDDDSDATEKLDKSSKESSPQETKTTGKHKEIELRNRNKREPERHNKELEIIAINEPENAKDLNNITIDTEVECTAFKQVNSEKDRTYESILNNSVGNPSLEIKIGTNTILPKDHFDDDRLFMLSLLPFLKKMDDDMRLTCRIEVLKVIKSALQIFGKRCESVVVKEENKSSEERELSRNTSTSSQTSALRMCRKRKNEESIEQSEQTQHQRRRGRPRKKESSEACWLMSDPEQSKHREERARRRLMRGDNSDREEWDEDKYYYRDRSDEARRQRARRREEARLNKDTEDELSRATSVTQLRTENFLKMYNLEPTKKPASPPAEVPIKKEPKDT